MTRLSKRVMGTENEYATYSKHIQSSLTIANEIVDAYRGRTKKHVNLHPTHESIVSELSEKHESGKGDYSDERVREDGSYKGAGSIIENGGRLYVDMGHPEYCTPETTNARDALIWNRAGEKIVNEAAKSVGDIQIFKDNSDGHGNSYGTHENYLMKRFSEDDFKNVVVSGLLPFFVTRQIFIGAGKVGVESQNVTSGRHYRRKCGNLESRNKDPFWDNFERSKRKLEESLDFLSTAFLDMPEFTEIDFKLRELLAKRKTFGTPEIYQLSQRADFFDTILNIHTTSQRPLINTRDDPHANREKYFRLHVINGDANRCEVAGYLKLGTTSLVLDLIEDGLVPKIFLADPVKQNKSISRDQSRQWLVELEGGSTTSAIAIQRQYLGRALEAYTGRDEITNDIMQRWSDTLDALETNPMELFGKVDWVTKHVLLSQIVGDENLILSNKKVAKTCLAYHNINPETSLFNALLTKGCIERIVSDEEISRAVVKSPEDTRAYLRAKVIKRKDVSRVDWSGFTIKSGIRRYRVSMPEPFIGNQNDLVGLHDTPQKIIPAQLLIDRLNKLQGINIKEERCFKY
jgi:hypothetical protein